MVLGSGMMGADALAVPMTTMPVSGNASIPVPGTINSSIGASFSSRDNCQKATIGMMLPNITFVSIAEASKVSSAAVADNAVPLTLAKPSVRLMGAEVVPTTKVKLNASMSLETTVPMSFTVMVPLMDAPVSVRFIVKTIESAEAWVGTPTMKPNSPRPAIMKQRAMHLSPVPATRWGLKG